MGANISVLGLLFDSNLNGPVSIGSGNTLSLYASGIDMSTANKNVTIGCGTTLAADQTWNVGSGLILTNRGAVAGTYNLTKTGAGTLTLSGANTWGNGKTFILSAGTVNINSGNALGNANDIFQINDGTTINNTSGAAITMTTANPLKFHGDFTFAGGGTGTDHDLTFKAGTTTLNGVSGARTITVTAANSTLGIPNVIGDGTATGLTKSGLGTLTLSGANTYSGATTVNGGVLRLNNTTALPGGIAATGGMNALTIINGVVELANGNLLRNLGTGVTQVQILGGTSGFSANGAARIVNFNNDAHKITWGDATFAPTTLVLNETTANNTLDFQNAIDLGASLRTVTVNANTATLSGVLTNGSLAKIGTGALTLSGANSFAGGLYIKEGKVELKNIAAAGNAANTIYLGDADTDANAILSIIIGSASMNANPISVVAGNAGSATINFAPVIGTSTGYVNGLITLNNHDLIVTAPADTGRIQGGITGTGNLTFANNALINVAVGTINTIGNVTFSHTGTQGTQIGSGGNGNINNTGAITNISTGTGSVTINNGIGSNVTAVVQNSTTSTMILSGANTFTGGVQHVAGTLNINSATALGTGPFTINTGTTFNSSAADVAMTANNAQNWNGDFTFTGSFNLNLGMGPVTLGANRQVTVSAKTLTVGGSISGIDFGLTKLGAGTLVLSGVNTYSGGTVVNAGTVTVTRAASLPGYATPGNVTVSGTGTLLAKVGVDGWTSTQISNLHASVGAGIGIDISNGNLDYTATSNVTFASITRGTAGTLRLIQDQANRVSVTSALSGLNSASGILPWAIITNTTLGRVDLAVGGAAGGYISALASYQTGAQSTWNSSTNARPSASESQNANNYLLGSLVLDNGINIGAKVLTIANGIILQTGGSSTYTGNSGTSPLAWGGSVIDTEGNLIITGVANDSYWGGAGAITKTGPGTLYLGVVNAFNSQQLSMSRDLFINQGLVEYSRNGGNLTQGWNAGGTVYFTGGNFMVHTVNGSDGNGTKNMSLAFMANAIFTLDNASTTFAAGSTTSLGTVATVAHSVTFKPVTVTITGGAHVNSGTAGLVLGTTNTAIHTVTLNGTPTLNVVNPSAGGTTELTLNGVIGDGGLGYGITKTGNGMLTLSGTNTYTGTNAVNVGTLRITQASCLSTNSSVSIAAGALMNLDFSGTNTVKALTLGTSPMAPGVYGVGKKGSFYFSGNGALNVTTGPSSPNGTMIRFF